MAAVELSIATEWQQTKTTTAAVVVVVVVEESNNYDDDNDDDDNNALYDNQKIKNKNKNTQLWTKVVSFLQFEIKGWV